MYKIFFYLTLFFAISLYGDKLSSLISQIKSAPIEQKRVLINRLKIKLRNLNVSQRTKVIHQLRGNTKHYTHNLQNTKQHQVHTKIHTQQQKVLETFNHSIIDLNDNIRKHSK